MQDVVVAQALERVRHGIGNRVHVRAVAAHAPAEFHAVTLVHDATAAGLGGNAAVHVPLAFIHELAAVLVRHPEVVNDDVPEVGTHQVPLRETGGGDVPHLLDSGRTVLGQEHVYIYVPDGGLIGKSGNPEEGRRQKGERAFHYEAEPVGGILMLGISVLPAGSLRYSLAPKCSRPAMRESGNIRTSWLNLVTVSL